MHLGFRTAAVAALFAASALSQITIPPHSAVYNGYSRGYNFTAATPFIITQLQLPPEAMQAGDTGSFLVRVNGVTALRTVGVAGASITPNLLINNGDIVDIIGNWSPAVTGNFTGHNSYTATGPNATTILGVPHTLTRTGWQWDIGDAGWAGGTYLAPVAGQMGRINMFVGAPAGFATATPYGTGCYNRFTSFYENFATAGAMDLSNSGFSMIPTGGGGYTVVPAIASFVAPTGAATVLTHADDTELPVTLPASFAYNGGSTTTLMTCSNGFVSVAAGNGVAFTPAAPAMLAAPQTGWWVWHDFNVTTAGSGTIKYEVVGSKGIVTWDGVYDHLGTSSANANTFQMQFDTASGAIHVVFQTMSTIGGTGFVVGYSPGGASQDPGNRDLSATLAASFTVGTTDSPALALAASARPVLGTNINLVTTNCGTATLGANILSFTQFNPGTSLAPLGMPGCQQYVGLDSVSLIFPVGGTGSRAFNIPSNPVYAGMHVFSQSAAFVVGANPLGVIASNGVDLLVNPN